MYVCTKYQTIWFYIVCIFLSFLKHLSVAYLTNNCIFFIEYGKIEKKKLKKKKTNETQTQR